VCTSATSATIPSWFRYFRLCPRRRGPLCEQPAAALLHAGPPEAIFTLTNNLVSTANLVHAVKEHHIDCHIIKLGTMAFTGRRTSTSKKAIWRWNTRAASTPSCIQGPGSLYHLTKAQDGDLLYFYCRMWGIRVTDLNQGPVYGLNTEESREDPRLLPIFNYDDIFGTVLNRFLVQAAARVPLTSMAGGTDSGLLNLMDTIACVELAMRQPAGAGEYRVFNQFVETFAVNELAARVQAAGRNLGLPVEIKNIPNPRLEAEEHYYNPPHRPFVSGPATPLSHGRRVGGDAPDRPDL